MVNKEPNFTYDSAELITIDNVPSKCCCHEHCSKKYTHFIRTKLNKIPLVIQLCRKHAREFNAYTFIENKNITLASECKYHEFEGKCKLYNKHILHNISEPKGCDDNGYCTCDHSPYPRNVCDDYKA